jgi:hypothetical protein
MSKGVYLTPSKLVILLFGGVRPLARLLDKKPSSISQWQITADGGVPRKCHVKLLELAKKRSVELSAEDLVFGRTLSPNKVTTTRLELKIDKRIKT